MTQKAFFIVFEGLLFGEIIKNSRHKLKKGIILYDPFSWMGFNCHKTTDPLCGDSLLFTTKSPETIVTKTGNSYKLPQTTTNNQKPLANNNKCPQTTSKQPQTTNRRLKTTNK